MSGKGIFSPLRHATFRNMWLSSTVSNTGSLIQSVAAAWTMAGIATADYVALVQTASFLPMALLALPAGAIADIYDRRRVQIAALSLACVGGTLMTLASILGLITPWVLLGFCFLVGSGGALSAPARGASVGEQVPKDLLPQAVGLNNISYNLARSIGPALGGVIVAALGATVAFAANALTYLPMLYSLHRWKRVAEVSRLPPEGLLRSVNSGLRYIVHMQPVRRTVLRAFIICFLGGALHSLMPLIARDLLGGGARTFGLLLGCFGVGAVSGIFVLQPMRTALGNENTVRACSLILGASLAVLAFSNSFLLDIVVLLGAGMVWMVLTTTISVAVQLSVPRWVAGRAIAMSSAATSLGIATGAWVWGLVAKEHGVSLVFQIAAAALLVSPLLGLFLRVADRTSSTESDERALADPDVKLGIGGRSGPISIELQYRIPSAKARDFYNLMRELQRIRSRNGAYDWSLSRNIGDPEQWSERFRCATWDDYLRQRSRRTLDDSALHERAHEMHVGIEPIKVLRWLDRPSGSVRWRDDAPDRGDDALRIQV
ncbi:MAG: transporter [Hydrocarboniphaga sp.]|uniref:MFS transporter n=1 Tax=Hydrocarboniphaga sp. TaxID=2033016 RepID=UPI0026165697|nr:MFS transporter [Hydrocarboniphaga sp.]MDB5972206.1 transporter [Hydrocarboniphaga sp.]